VLVRLQWLQEPSEFKATPGSWDCRAVLVL